MNEIHTLFNFAEPATAQGWRSIDDRIMGGCSQSHAEFVAGSGLRFHGNVSLDNNGGFASIRSPNADYSLEGFNGLSLRLRGDGQRYKLGLRTDRFFDGISYQVTFQTVAGMWQEVSFSFHDFVATHHGHRLTTAAPLDPACIESFGLFIAGRQAGPFRLEVAWIRAGRQQSGETP